MGALREIEELQRRKELLVARSRSYRELLQADYEQLRASTAWIERTYHFVRKTYPVYVLLAPLAGYFSFKKRRSIKNFGGKALIGFQLFRRLWPLFQKLKSRKPTEHAD
jgi:hypothetical protein